MRWRRPAIELLAVQVLLAAYGGAFISRTSFIVQGERYFALSDPAMGAMQQARHLAAGQEWRWSILADQPIVDALDGGDAPVAAAALDDLGPSVLVKVAAAGVLLANVDFHGTTAWKRWALIQRPLGVTANRRHVEMARRLESITTVRATIGATETGSLGYFATRRCIDVDSAAALRPDVVLAPWDGLASNFLADYHGYDWGALGTILLRRDSDQIVLAPSDRLANQLWWDGLLLQQRGCLEEALDHFARAIALGPPSDTWPYHFGALLVERRSLAEVEAYYDRTGPQDRRPHIGEYCRGVALARATQFDQAVVRFQRALAIDPAHEMSYEMLGNVMAAQGRFEAANAFYRTALDIVPEFASAHRNPSLERLGRHEEAQAHLRLASAGDPSSAQRCFYWGRFLMSQGHAQLAIAPLEYAIASDPDHAAARRLLQQARRDVGTTP